MPSRPLSALVPACAGLLLLSGCGGASAAWSRQQAVFEARNGQVATAEARINGLYGSHLDGEPAEVGGGPRAGRAFDEKHLLLWCMERGSLAQLRDDPAASNRLLDDAAYLVDYRRIVSFGREVGTYLLNDTLREYAGAPFEHTQVDAQRVLNHFILAEQAEGRARFPFGPLIAGATGASTLAAPPPAGPGEASAHYERAVNIARRMVLSQLKEAEDAAAGRRYRDDPFARLLAGAVIAALPPGERVAGDEDFAGLMFERALAAYAEHHRQFGDGRAARYEVAARPAVAERLYLRHLLAQDPVQARERAERAGISDAERRLAEAKPAAGTGQVLLLDLAGVVARPEPLSISLVSVAGIPPATRHGSYFSIGSVWFQASGPGQDSVRHWHPILLPGDILRHLSPGGISVMGFELPAYADDRPLAPGMRVRFEGAGGLVQDVACEPVCDLDAYARGNLLDLHPAIVAKTIIRAVSKQVAVGAGAHALKKRDHDLGAFLLNLAGSLVATASEEADCRSWSLLPDHIGAAVLDLPVGRWRVSLPGLGAGEVEVVPDRLAILPLRTFPEPVLAPAPQR